MKVVPSTGIILFRTSELPLARRSDGGLLKPHGWLGAFGRDGKVYRPSLCFTEIWKDGVVVVVFSVGVLGV